MQLRTASAVVALALAAPAPAVLADEHGSSARSSARFEVRVTNLTRDQSFTPLLVVAHRPQVRLFAPGAPAGPELEALAEEGNTAPFEAMLSGLAGVSGVATGAGLLGPGHSTTIQVEGHRWDRISLAAMLIPTNDGFVALDGAGPFGQGWQSFDPPAYDAGTEMNDETCASIPGPFYEECGGPGGGGAPSGGEEGFVRIHEGIHGVGDFLANRRDWRNPVAHVSIRRVR
jgi:Spondin_N